MKKREPTPPWLTGGVVGLIVGIAVGAAVGPEVRRHLPFGPYRGWIGPAADPRQSPSVTPFPRTGPASPNGQPPGRALAERVVIITVDGLRPDLLTVADAPHIRGLAAAGSYTFWAQTVADPHVYTLPAHVSMLTGVAPDRHGVTWNGYIEESYPLVPTLFELAKARGLSTALVSGKMKFVALTRPGSLDHAYLPPDEPVDDAVVAEQAVDIVRRRRPHVLFVHLPGVDTAGHATGWGSPEQRAAVGAADAAVGRVLNAVRSAGLADRTIVFLTADHGGAGGSHGPGDPRSRTIPWIVAGPGVRAGADLTLDPAGPVRAEDTFATACAVLGIPPPPHTEGAFVEPILEGRELLRPIVDSPPVE